MKGYADGPPLVLARLHAANLGASQRHAGQRGALVRKDLERNRIRHRLHRRSSPAGSESVMTAPRADAGSLHWEDSSTRSRMRLAEDELLLLHREPRLRSCLAR